MSWGLIAVGVGTAVAGATSAISSKSASAAQSKSARQAGWAQLAANDQLRADLFPWVDAARQTMPRVLDRLRKGPGEFVPEEQPGYEFGFKEFIEKPYLKNQNARGRLYSGESGKALTRYASDYASTMFDNFLNRYYKSLEPDLEVGRMGQASAAQQAQGAVNTGALTGNYLTNAGNARANNAINLGNTISGGVSSGLENWITLQNLNKKYPYQTTGNNYLSGGYNRTILDKVNY